MFYQINKFYNQVYVIRILQKSVYVLMIFKISCSTLELQYQYRADTALLESANVLVQVPGIMCAEQNDIHSYLPILQAQ